MNQIPKLVGLLVITCATVSVFFALVTQPTMAAGPTCLTADPKLMFDTSQNCDSVPRIPRVLGSQEFAWRGMSLLAVNVGNDIALFDTVANKIIAGSWYEGAVGHVGDSDYDLYNFSLCDNCRYGVSNYKKGTVLFDMGTEAKPVFGPPAVNFSARKVPGAFTFSHGGRQYLIAAGLMDECAGGHSTLYEFTGTDEETGLVRVGCVSAGGVPAKILGGYHVGDYLYLGDKSQHVYIFKITGAGSTIALNCVSSPWVSFFLKDRGLAVDLDHHIAIEARTTGMNVWDISSPGEPVKMAMVLGDVNRAAVSWPLAFVARSGFAGSERTFYIGNPSAPVEVEASFWEPSQPWNWPGHLCSDIQAGAIVGDSLYLLRYSRLQRVVIGDCEPPNPMIFVDGFESGDITNWQ